MLSIKSFFLHQLSLNSSSLVSVCYWTWPESACPCTVKPIYWHWVAVMKSTVFIEGHQAKSPDSIQRPELSTGFQRLKPWVSLRGWGRGVCGMCDQLVDFLVIGWCWGNQEAVSSTYWFQKSRVYMLMGNMELTSSTWWGIWYLQNSLKDIAQKLSISLQE